MARIVMLYRIIFCFVRTRLEYVKSTFLYLFTFMLKSCDSLDRCGNLVLVVMATSVKYMANVRICCET